MRSVVRICIERGCNAFVRPPWDPKLGARCPHHVVAHPERRNAEARRKRARNKRSVFTSRAPHSALKATHATQLSRVRRGRPVLPVTTGLTVASWRQLRIRRLRGRRASSTRRRRSSPARMRPRASRSRRARGVPGRATAPPLRSERRLPRMRLAPAAHTPPARFPETAGLQGEPGSKGRMSGRPAPAFVSSRPAFVRGGVSVCDEADSSEE